MKIEFRKPTQLDGKEIATWKYEGEYAFYNSDKTEAKQQWALGIDQEDNTYVIYTERGKLIGNCCFDYDEDDGWTFGVQMRPDLTGRGMGREIVNAIIAYGKEMYHYDTLSLLVAKFNKRAIHLYTQLGFYVVEEFEWHVNGGNYDFVAMSRKI